MSVTKSEETSTTYTADKRLYLNRDKSEIVEEDSPEAAFLLAAEGQEVSQEDVEKYGLLNSGQGTESAEASEAPKESNEPTPEKTPTKKAGKKKSTNTDPVKANKARK